MAIRTPVEQTEGLYFITFTCCQWLPLFEITNGYDTIYKWFDYLKSKNHFVKGYVIMPNHFACSYGIFLIGKKYQYNSE